MYYIYLPKYLYPILSQNLSIFLKKLSIMIIAFIWVALGLTRILPTFLWKKLLRTVSTIYSQIIFTVVEIFK